MKEYLLSITNIDDLRLINFWLRIKSTVRMNITEGHITLSGLKKLKNDIEEIIKELED